MRVQIIGGGGVFGSRLARLLVRDGHDVTLASRTAKSVSTLAAELGCAVAIVDRDGDLSAALNSKPDVIIDAAGPFQCYQSDPYGLVRFCIDNGVNYLDLSDDAGFTVGAAAFDEQAKRAGVFVLSGASSVPAISSAAVIALSSAMRRIDTIETVILPGNRAPRGWSLVAAILQQAGKPLRVWRGKWIKAEAWSEPKRYEIGRGLARVGRLIGAPDVLIFPERFQAKSVTFRAGMELGVLNWAVSAFAWLHKRNWLRPSKAVVDLALAASHLLEPFGGDRGAMIVRVAGEEGGAPARRQWRLTAEAGDGPFMPAIPIRALLRRPGAIEPGARPCVGELTLDEAVSATSDLRVSTECEETRPLFQHALSKAWGKLPLEVRDLHNVPSAARFEGWAKVERGGNFLALLLARIFSFPEAAAAIPVSVTIEETERGEIWTREFGAKRFRSYLSRGTNGASTIVERFGLLSFDITLEVRGDELHFPVSRGRLLGLPLPKWLLPVSETREFVHEGKFHFDVALSGPIGLGLMVRYQGYLEQVASRLTAQEAA